MGNGSPRCRRVGASPVRARGCAYPVPMALDYTDDLRLAHVLADDADALTTARFKALDLHVMTKPDLSPVTDADKSVEDGIRRTLSRARPRDAVYGEEGGATGHGQRRWVVDPIDGTKNFVRGVPVWATLIALMVDGEVVVGVVSAPQLNRRWWAMKRRRRLDGQVAVARHRSPGLRRLPDRGRIPVLLLTRRLGGARPARRLPGPVAPVLAHPRVRRLLVLHADRRGCRRPRRRARARALRHGSDRRDRARGRRDLHLARRRARPERRERAGQQRQAARPGTGVPGIGRRGVQARPAWRRVGARPVPSVARGPTDED